MSDITVNQKVKNDWLDVIRDNIDKLPTYSWATVPSKLDVGETISPTDLMTYPYVFKASSLPVSLTNLTVTSGVASFTSVNHDLVPGELITIIGAVPSQLNVEWTVGSTPDLNTVEFNVLDLPDLVATGTITFTRNKVSKGVVEPVWPSLEGSTVVDNKVIWTNLGGRKGKIRIYSGKRPQVGQLITDQVLLAELFFSYPSAAAAESSTLTFSPIDPDTNANATGTATWARILDVSDNNIYDCSVTTLDKDGDIKLASTNIVSGGTVSISNAILTIQ